MNSPVVNPLDPEHRNPPVQNNTLLGVGYDTIAAC
jgi:hypothetical protein